MQLPWRSTSTCSRHSCAGCGCALLRLSWQAGGGQAAKCRRLLVAAGLGGDHARRGATAAQGHAGCRLACRQQPLA
jgi:hypothetical protein